MEPNPHDRLELALLASNEGVWDWYVGKEKIYYSDRVLDFLGYGKDEAPNILVHAKEYFHPEDYPGLRSAFKAAVAESGDGTLAADCRYRHPDGEWRWLRIRGVTVRDDSSKVVRMVGSIIDISRRKKAEVALEEERFRLTQLIETIPLKVYYKDSRSRFVMANSSLAEWLGCDSVDDVIGKTDHDFFGSVHADQALADELKIMETRKPELDVIECETWEGKENTWVKTSKLPWLDIKGNLLGTFGISNDITDLVVTQKRLAELAEELRKRNVAFEEELQLAREIQQALLPRDLDGLVLCAKGYKATFGCRYTPASEMAGDFFEVIPISRHCIGILVCDVMGHGVRASLVVSMLRGLMEKERDYANSPERFLCGVNDGLVSIFERAGVTLFATAAYCVIDLREGTLRYACAGHPAPIMVHNGHGRQLVEAEEITNPALGLIPGASFAAETLALDAMDRLLIFTDGLHEVENSDGEQLGIDNITSFWEQHSGDDLETSLNGLLQKAKHHSQAGQFDDDVCLFAIDVTPCQKC